MTDQFSPWRTSDEAACRARAGKRTVHRAAAAGDLKSVKVANRLLFLDAWIDDWLMSQPSGCEVDATTQLSRKVAS